MSEPTPYDKSFADAATQDSLRSARKIVPYLIAKYDPRSVVDVGCCLGAWLSVFASSRVPITGIDGAYVDQSQLLIKPEEFIALDLESQELPSRRYDMALCIEVAEHLTPEAGRRTIGWLCKHADVVVWSAAIPGQGGTNHINEQWPSIWRKEFKQRGFVPSYALRELFWDDRDVGFCVRQNILVYAAFMDEPWGPIDVVHPDFFHFKLNGWGSTAFRGLK